MRPKTPKQPVGIPGMAACPFCGKDIIGANDHVSYCKTCFARGPRVQPWEAKTLDGLYQLIVDRWNTRHGKGK